MTVMGNLVDVMLVFACGLIAALIVRSPELVKALQPTPQEVEQGRELPAMPDSAGEGGSGMESVGTVYRDPENRQAHPRGRRTMSWAIPCSCCGPRRGPMTTPLKAPKSSSRTIDRRGPQIRSPLRLR